MAMIRFSDEEVFNTDSQEYDVLYNAAAAVKVDGAVVEIGTRRGGSAKLIIDTLVENNQALNRPMFCIDPYGNIDYPETNKALTVFSPNVKTQGDPHSTEINNNIKHDYDNNMRNRIIPSLYYCAYAAGLNFTFFCLEDTEFFNRYADGVPLYNEHKTIENKYAFVFFDGPHINSAVETEINFFLSRTVVGSVFVFDDIWMYSHDKFEQILFDNGWEILEKKQIKASYIKVK